MDSMIQLPGRIEKIVDVYNGEHAQISFSGASVLYDELRVPNTHKWEVGNRVEVTIRRL